MNYNKNKKLTEQMHKISLCLSFFVALCLICISGCSQQQVTTGNAMVTETSEVSRAMQAAEDVLIKMHFDIAKADYEKTFGQKGN